MREAQLHVCIIVYCDALYKLSKPPPLKRGAATVSEIWTSLEERTPGSTARGTPEAPFFELAVSVYSIPKAHDRLTLGAYLA